MPRDHDNNFGVAIESPSGRVGQPNGGLQPDQVGLGHWVGSGGFLAGFYAKPSAKPNFYWLTYDYCIDYYINYSYF